MKLGGIPFLPLHVSEYCMGRVLKNWACSCVCIATKYASVSCLSRFGKYMHDTNIIPWNLWNLNSSLFTGRQEKSFLDSIILYCECWAGS